jgi:hypothetical protein
MNALGVLERIAGVVLELDSVDASAVEKSEHLLTAMQELRRAGLGLVLVPTGTTARLTKSRRRWWRRAEWRNDGRPR